MNNLRKSNHRLEKKMVEILFYMQDRRSILAVPSLQTKIADRFQVKIQGNRSAKDEDDIKCMSGIATVFFATHSRLLLPDFEAIP